jgi:phosphatidylserine decarboxylase
MKFARGSRYLIISPIISLFLFLFLFIIFRLEVIGSIFLLLTLITFLISIVMVIFFRDPEREIGKGIVACADGRIREIIKIEDDDIKDCIKISTFMNIYNVHVNRMPIDGIINNITHNSGIHLPAFKKESENNERVIITVDTKIGKIKIIQIAGTIARRIYPYIKKENKLKKGDRIGIIKFGSRVDIYLPSKNVKKISVKKGDIVKAGESKIAEIND